MYERDDVYSNDNNYLTKAEMNVDLFVYTALGTGRNVVPVTSINTLLDAIDVAVNSPGYKSLSLTK